MGFLIRTSLGLLATAIVAGFAINHVPSWKEKTMEIINPSAQEQRLLIDLEKDLKALDTSLNTNAHTDKNNPDNDSVSRNRELIAHSNTLIAKLQDINQKNSGILKSSLNKITSTIFDQTPYPAEDLTTNSPSPQIVCPTPKQ